MGYSSVRRNSADHLLDFQKGLSPEPYTMWKRITIGHIIIFILILGIGYSIWRDKVLFNNARFTIGTTEDISWSVASGRFIEFNYTVNGRSYTNSDNYLNDKIKANCKCIYFVKYNPKDPSQSKLLQKVPVPDRIKFAPPNGWDKIPGE